MHASENNIKHNKGSINQPRVFSYPKEYTWTTPSSPTLIYNTDLHSVYDTVNLQVVVTS